MTRMRIRKDEWYPVYFLDPFISYKKSKEYEISDDILQEYQDALNKWDEVQTKLEKIYNE